jgi:hypothetical protein
VVTVGEATGLAQVVQLNPVAGAHAYVPPPVAFSVVFDPVQMETSGPAFATGVEFTVTVTVAVFVQPFALVPVTVYVVVAVGDAVTVAPVVALNPVAGAQA